MTVHAYLRVSTKEQSLSRQELNIRRFVESEGLTVDNWVKIKVSSSRSTEQRLIDSLINSVKNGDTLIVDEVSRLCRSINQLLNIVNTLIDRGVRFIALNPKLDVNNELDIVSKTLVTLFGLMAEIEKDFIKKRTKAGLEAAQARGVKLGPPKVGNGNGHSKMDKHCDKIVQLMQLGATKRAIAKNINVSYSNLMRYIRLKDLKRGL